MITQLLVAPRTGAVYDESSLHFELHHDGMCEVPSLRLLLRHVALHFERLLDQQKLATPHILGT